MWIDNLQQIQQYIQQQGQKPLKKNDLSKWFDQQQRNYEKLDDWQKQQIDLHLQNFNEYYLDRQEKWDHKLSIVQNTYNKNENLDKKTKQWIQMNQYQYFSKNMDEKRCQKWKKHKEQYQKHYINENFIRFQKFINKKNDEKQPISIKKKTQRSKSEKKYKQKTQCCNGRRLILPEERQNKWLQFYGNNFYSKCWCCKGHISPFNYHMGHIVSLKNNGIDDLDNMIPICSQCNLLCGVSNLNEFKKQYYPV